MIHTRTPTSLWTLSSLSLALLAGGVGACSSKSSSLDESLSDASESIEIPNANVAGSTSIAKTLTASSKSAVPGIPNSPFLAEGIAMNAFYFVRDASESWESISQTLYGRTDRSENLRRWNPEGGLFVGRVLFYNSALRPDDMQNMKVFAEDFGFPLEQVTVQSGDWLSKIGASTYGNLARWVEIAALNPEIQNPDLIYPGQVIRLQPANIDTAPVIAKLVEAAQQLVASQSAQVQNSDLATSPEATPESASPSSVAAIQPAESMYSQLLKSLGKTEVIAVGILGIVVALVLYRRRKQRSVIEELAKSLPSSRSAL